MGRAEDSPVPDGDWARAEQNKLLYILLMVVLGVVGTIVYAVVARPALRRAGADLQPAR